MKKLVYIFLAMLAVTVAGCRIDGGDVGLLRGEWAFRDYTVDKDTVDVDLERYYLLFHGHIVFVKEVLPYNRYVNTPGTWTQEGDILQLDFTHYREVDSLGNRRPYTPPAALGIPGGTVTEMHIDRLTDKLLQMQFTDSLGRVNRYTLEKIN